MYPPQYDLAFRDIVDGVKGWQLWGRKGWTDVRARYRRTALGPFWATISLGIFMVSFGLVWAFLWKMSVRDYMPFVGAGMLSWTLISAIVVDGTASFSVQKTLLESIRFPLTIITCSVIWRNLILFFHNLIIYVVIAFFCGIPFTQATWLVIPALFLICLNGLWVATLLGMIGTRYRDVQQLITSLLQIILFMTPIFWNTDQLPAASHSRFFLVDLNPVFQYVDILRAPLLGKAPALATWGKVLGMTVVGMLITFEVYARFRRRLTYWL